MGVLAVAAYQYICNTGVLPVGRVSDASRLRRFATHRQLERGLAPASGADHSEPAARTTTLPGVQRLLHIQDFHVEAVPHPPTPLLLLGIPGVAAGCQAGGRHFSNCSLYCRRVLTLVS